MKPIETDTTNFTYSLPGGTVENDLPCRRVDGNVFSVWEPDELDLGALSSELPQVVLSIYWPSALTASIKVGDGDEHSTVPDALGLDRVENNDGSYWMYTHVLDDREERMLRDGAKVEIMVGMMPPPPVSLTCA